MFLTITVWEKQCHTYDYDTENGSGFPDDTKTFIDATFEYTDADYLLWAEDKCAKKRGGPAFAQAMLDKLGFGEWDGGSVAYDQDGTTTSGNGFVTYERWAVIS